MSETFECFKCGKTMAEGEVSVGMNIGFGDQYWCHICAPPPKSSEEVIRMMDGVINPPRENPDHGQG